MSKPRYTKPEFSDAFNSGFGSCRYTCSCGREHYDPVNDYTWEPGELEALEDDAEAISHNGAFTIFEINGHSLVDGCPCEGALNFQKTIERNAKRIAQYLRHLKSEAAEKAADLEI